MAAEREITLKISAEASKLNATLNEAARKIDKFAAETGGAFKNLEKSLLSFTTRIAAIAAPFVAVGAALGVMVQKTANAGDEILKMSQKVGVSVEKLSALQYAARASNVSNEELSVSLGHLAKNMVEADKGTGDAVDTFKALGLSVKDSSGKMKSTDTLLIELADKFSKMEDGAGKTAIAMTLFGRSGKELIPFLNAGWEGIKELTDEAEKMGIVFSKDSASAAEKFNDNITKIKEQLNALIYAVGNKLIPAFNQLIGSGDGVLKIGYAIGGIFQGAASSALFLSSGIFKLISGLALLTDKLHITKGEYKRWSEESRIALESSIALAKQGQENIFNLFTPTSAHAATEGKGSVNKIQAPAIVDSKKIETEREKARKEAFEKEKKYNAMLADNWKETTKRLREEDDKYRDDRIKLRDEELKAMADVEQNQLDINNKLKGDTLNNQLSLMSEKERLDTEYLLKKTEMEKAGITDMKALYEWYYSEIEVMSKKAETKPDSFLQKIQKAVDSLGKALTGSTSSTEGLGAMVSSIVDLIKTITNLPKLLNTLLKELFTNLKHFPRELVNLIKDVLVNLPNILLELITTLITELIPILVSEIPNMIIKMVSGLFEAIKTLIFGGEIKSTIDGWADDVSNQSVTVNLDTGEAMQALKYAQDALLGAVHETDRKVAREALLSARQAAILSEKQKQDAQNQKKEAETKNLKGIFGYLGELFSSLWESLKSIFSSAWEGLKNILGGLWEGLNNIFTYAWEGLKALLDSILGAIGNLWEGFKNFLGGAWEGLKALLDS